MVMDSLGGSLRKTVDALRGKARLDAEDVDEVVRAPTT